MRRVLWLGGTVLMLGLLMASMAAASALRDGAAGGGRTAAFQFSLGATGVTTDPNGSNINGAVSFQGLNAGIPSFTGKVTCLVVVGNLATVGGAADIDFAPFGQFKGFAFQVLDNGQPVGGQPVDLLSPVYLLPESPTEDSCVFPGLAPEFPMTEGNVVVRDALLTP
jgi:hypothetical protein